MSTLKVPCDDFYLSSAWQCWNVTVANGVPTGKFTFKDKPSTDTKTVHFSADLPSGAKVSKVQVWAKITSPFTGYAIRTANGNSFTLKWEGGEVGADLPTEGFDGNIDVTFKFKANGNTVDTNQHRSAMEFKDVYLWVEYDDGVVQTDDTIDDTSDVEAAEPAEFVVPPQSVCIYHQGTGKIYMFDGVTKIQHTFTTKLDENAKADSKDKDKVINNATNEPDKLTLDVVMSDVYSDDSNMTIAKGWDADAQSTAYEQSKSSIISDFTRSGNAVYVLRRLKESREKLSVITPQYVHVDMIIASVTVTQDDTCPFGWVGQIEFQHAFRPKPPEEQWKSPTDTGSPTTSNAVETVKNFLTGEDSGGTTNETSGTKTEAPANSAVKLAVQGVAGVLKSINLSGLNK